MNIMIIALCPSHQLVMPRSWNISILHTPWDFSTDTPQGEIAGMLDKPEWRCLNVRCGSLSRAIFLKTAHVFSFKAIPFSPLEWQLLNVGYSVCVCVCLLGFPAFILSWFRYCLHSSGVSQMAFEAYPTNASSFTVGSQSECSSQRPNNVFTGHWTLKLLLMDSGINRTQNILACG